MKKVFWTETAKITFQKTTEFVRKVWDEKVLEELLEVFDYRISQVRKNPEIGVRYTNTPFRRLVIHKTVSVFYKVDEDSIRLLVIWDNRQDPEQLLAHLLRF